MPNGGYFPFLYYVFIILNHAFDSH
uniref:Uncharacterized protein n=1 Tax=Rhizophora mucronata TaxID=61149 RepID=A0A2P2P074_RHIMU